jgi:hypothetical protein
MFSTVAHVSHEHGVWPKYLALPILEEMSRLAIQTQDLAAVMFTLMSYALTYNTANIATKPFGIFLLMRVTTNRLDRQVEADRSIRRFSSCQESEPKSVPILLPRWDGPAFKTRCGLKIKRVQKLFLELYQAFRPHRKS